jgi:hypothetical protein
MDTVGSHSHRLVRRREPVRWGAVAVAAVGGLTIECDEALSGPESWQITIESSAISLSFRVKCRGAAEELHEFLASPRGPGERTHLAVGRGLRLVADDEIAGRVFLLVGTRASLVRITLSRDEARDAAAALRDVLEQWAA